MTTTHPRFNVLGKQEALTLEKYRELDARGVNLDSWADFHAFTDAYYAPPHGPTGLGQLILNVAALTGSRVRS